MGLQNLIDKGLEADKRLEEIKKRFIASQRAEKEEANRFQHLRHQMDETFEELQHYVVTCNNPEAISDLAWDSHIDCFMKFNHWFEDTGQLTELKTIAQESKLLMEQIQDARLSNSPTFDWREVFRRCDMMNLAASLVVDAPKEKRDALKALLSIKDNIFKLKSDFGLLKTDFVIGSRQLLDNYKKEFEAATNPKAVESEQKDWDRESTKLAVQIRIYADENGHLPAVTWPSIIEALSAEFPGEFYPEPDGMRDRCKNYCEANIELRMIHDRRGRKKKSIFKDWPFSINDVRKFFDQ